MKFKVQPVGKFWEVGFFNPAGQWICLQAFNNQAEAESECIRLTGGNV